VPGDDNFDDVPANKDCVDTAFQQVRNELQQGLYQTQHVRIILWKFIRALFSLEHIFNLFPFRLSLGRDYQRHSRQSILLAR